MSAKLWSKDPHLKWRVLLLIILIIVAVWTSSCARKRELGRTDWIERQIEFVDKGDEAPFGGILITERLFMELFEDAELKLLEK